MAALLIIFEIAFIINTTISLALNFFSAKSKSISIIKLIIKKFQGKKKEDKSEEGTLLESLDETGHEIEKSKKKSSKEDKEDILNERSEVFVTLITYFITVTIAYYSDNIITIDNFNGSTVNNYLSVMLPGLFFIILTNKEKFSFEKLIAILLILFSFGLITGYLLLNFTSIFA